MENHRQKGSETELPASVPPEAAVAETRRRLLKAGVPIVLTLASRPVLAWHCKSPSAWGSEQINPHTSLKPGHDAGALPDESWTINNWINNTSRAGLGQPWNVLGLDTTHPNNANYYKKYKVSTLFAGLNIPIGLNGTEFVWDYISHHAASFQTYMIVARLNYKLIVDIRKCLTSYGGSDELNRMATGSYSPPNIPNVLWNQSDIMSYLQNNWIVVPS